MLAPFAALLEEHRRRGSALGAFTCYNLESAVGVLRAAETHRTPVVLLVGAASFRASGGELFVAALRAAADRAPVRACLQLDHADDLELIEAALYAGVGAVMADGSKRDDNLEWTREAAALAARHGAVVEAELGGIAGDEDGATAIEVGALTDPAEAETFAAESRAACLAVSIGNVHGAYRSPPRLDWERLRAIRERVAVPLSLHGASGIPDDQVRRSIELGISKVNVNTELRERYLDETAARLPAVRDGARLLQLGGAQADAIAAVARSKLALYETR